MFSYTILPFSKRILRLKLYISNAMVCMACMQTRWQVYIAYHYDEVLRVVSEWCVDEVCHWLRVNNFDDYQESFRTNDIHGRELLTLSRCDLKACNMLLLLTKLDTVLKIRTLRNRIVTIHRQRLLCDVTTMKKIMAWPAFITSMPIKIRTYKALVLSTLLYAAETWTLRAEDARVLESFHMKCNVRYLASNGRIMSETLK